MKVLINQDALDFLKMYNIQTLDYEKMNSFSNVGKNFPFVLKTVSKHIPNKEERNLVKFVYTSEHLEDYWYRLRKQGHVVRQDFLEGHNLVVQITNSLHKPQLLIGMSGVSVDIYKDFIQESCPVSKEDAKRMLSKLKVFPHLEKHKGKKTNLDDVAKEISKLSKLAVNESSLLALEVDPIIVNHKATKVVDAKLIFEK